MNCYILAHRSGNVGIIQFVENDNDVAWLVENATVSPYMAVLQPSMFTKYVLNYLLYILLSYMIRNVLTRRREYGTYLATARRHRGKRDE